MKGDTTLKFKDKDIEGCDYAYTNVWVYKCMYINKYTESACVRVCECVSLCINKWC